MKLLSTPVPVLALASKIVKPVLFVNSRISSSETYLSGNFAPSSPYTPPPRLAASTTSYLLAITMI